ncbi:ComF family protein [Erythrobacter sp.]|uniref:ComF family protein n=1 Tax=Erythrobacter sp. TaxID=1042 RepID=UPI003C73712C
MGVASTIAEGLRPVVDLVYPPRCPLCGDAIAAQGALCVECWNALELPSEPGCASCQRPLAEPADRSAICFACTAEPPRHSGIHAASVYNDASRKLVLTYKHGGKIALAPLLGRLVAGRLPAAAENPPLLVPVPLHRWRLWQRGFNQAALLAREIAKTGKGDLLVDALQRHRPTPSLGGLGREAREKVLSGAVRVRPSAQGMLSGRDVVLVDDVLTSGATAKACTAALLDAGAKSVRIACFARVVD